MIIGLPVAGIVGMLSWSQLKSGPEKVVIDPNQEIEELERKIPGFTEEYKAIVKLIRAERIEQGNARGRKLSDNLNQWLVDWEAVFESRRDENDDLPPDLQGYRNVPVPVGRLKNDLMRIMEF